MNENKRNKVELPMNSELADIQGKSTKVRALTNIKEARSFILFSIENGNDGKSFNLLSSLMGPHDMLELLSGLHTYKKELKKELMKAMKKMNAYKLENDMDQGE